MSLIYIIIILLLISIVNAVDFYILIYPELTVKEAFKLITTATALNKLLFTGSGYLTASYLSRNKNLPFYKALSAFLLLEAMGVSLWLGLGVYFGSKFAVKMPAITVPILVLIMLLIWLRRQKFIKAVKKILTALKDMGKRLPSIMPFIILNMILFFGYYFFLFRFFNFHPQPLEIIKIISVSFTIGYLSPAPAGAGFKDTGLVLLLMNGGLALNPAIFIAVFDRIFVIVFWGLLGGIFGYSLLKNEIKRRFKRSG